MNNVLELKGKRFIQASKTGSGGGASMNSKKIVTREQLLRLIERISQIKEFWKQEKRPFEGILISVHYNKIVAKSNRIAGLFKGKDSNYAIVGAKFNKEKTKHIITYFLDMEDLDKSIELLLKTSDIIKVKFQNGIDKVTFDDRKKIDKIPFSKFSITKSTFKQVIADVSYIEDFEVEMATRQLKQSIITLYNTHTDTKMLFENIGIDILKSRILDNQTVFLDENQLQILFEKAPYLVSMATEDLSELSPEDFIQEYQQGTLYMPSPTIEPTVGVIDTLFDKRVYFGEWVEYHDKIDDIVHTKEDEIKFLVYDVSEKWNTYNYYFPVPIKDDKYPYIARATMCYFPMCDRTQGVDYTNTELNLHFGRINNKGKIEDIKGDKQNQDVILDNEKYFLLEGEARERFRKWDNVKYIAERPKNKMMPKKSYDNKNWGMEIKTNNRLDPKDGIGIRFGVVVTLKEINGVNRIDEFIKNCTLNGWLVNKIDVQTRVDINKKVNEDIEFE